MKGLIEKKERRSWTGRDILTPLLVLGGIGAGYFLHGKLAGDELLTDLQWLAFPAGLMLASGCNWWIGRLSNGWSIETETLPDGEERVLPKPHTFLFVPMELWSVLMVIAALIVGCNTGNRNELLPPAFEGDEQAWAADMKAKLADPRAGDYYLFDPPADDFPYLFRVTGVTDSLLRLQSLAAPPGQVRQYMDLEAVRAAQNRTPPESPGSWVDRRDLLWSRQGQSAPGVQLPEIDSFVLYRLVWILR